MSRLRAVSYSDDGSLGYSGITNELHNFVTDIIGKG